MEWFEYWRCLISVKYVSFEELPENARYLCSDLNEAGEYVDYYDVDCPYICGVLEN